MQHLMKTESVKLTFDITGYHGLFETFGITKKKKKTVGCAMYGRDCTSFARETGKRRGQGLPVVSSSVIISFS
jgi:hypothetical protein